MTPIFDIARARRETPGCEYVIHFNNAGAGLMPAPVLNAIQEHLQLETRIGGYEAVDKQHARIEHVYDAVSQLISADREEIAIVENATRAWDMAFYAIPFQRGDRVLTSMAEYGSNYIAFLQLAQKSGIVIEPVPDDEYGQISVEALERMIDPHVRLIAITHIPTNGGLVNPAEEVGRVARSANILYLLDACQSAGQLPLDVNRIGCDMLSATARKFLRGPRGMGFLYVRKPVIENLEPPFLDLHAATWIGKDRFEIRQDARRFENWETNYAAKIGLGVAVDYAMDWGIDKIWERVQFLAGKLRTGLENIPGVKVRDLGKVRCGIVSFTVDGQDPQEIKNNLAKKGINVTTTSVLGTRLDMERRNLQLMVRASLHYYNTEHEIEHFLKALVAEIGNQ